MGLDRRRFIRNAGAVAAGVGLFSTTASAQNHDEEHHEKTVREVHRLQLEGRRNEAEQILDEENIEREFWKRGESSPSTDGNTDSGPDHYSGDRSEINLSFTQTSFMDDHEYLATATWDLRETSGFRRSTGPVDPVGIRWNDSFWQGREENENNFIASNDRLEYEEYKLHGVWGYYEPEETVNWSGQNEDGASMQTYIEQINRNIPGEEYNVTAEYNHIYNYSGSIDNISVSFGPAGFDISSWISHDWEIATTEKK